MRVQVMIDTPPPPRSIPQQPHITVEERVRDALDCIDSGYESPVEWRMVCGLFQHLLKSGKRSPREQNLLDMIQPILAKYGYYESVE